MTTPINDGGPAFPRDAIKSYHGNHGMSLRDWFAGQALAGYNASTQYDTTSDIITRWAYLDADAMLAARAAANKENT